MKSALITGSGRGLGKALALAFSGLGYRIILHGQNYSNLVSTQKEIQTDSFIVCGDISSSYILGCLQDKSNDWKPDVVVNNAGVPCPGLPFDQISESQIKEIISVNVLSPILLIKKVLPVLKNNSGTIININSVCGCEPKKNRTVYCSSRWAMRGFDASFRLECELYGVKLITIYPSRIKTRPEFVDGMEVSSVVEKIMSLYMSGQSSFCKIDDRPEHLEPSEQHYA